MAPGEELGYQLSGDGAGFDEPRRARARADASVTGATDVAV